MSKFKSSLRQLLELTIRRVDFQIFEWLPSRGTQASTPGLEVRTITSEDLKRLETFIQTENVASGAAIARLHDAISRRYTGYLALYHHELVGYAWHCPAQMNHPQLAALDIKFPAENTFGFDLFIAPNWRSGNLPYKIITAFCAYGVHTTSSRRLIGLVDKNNRRSALVHIRSGYRRIGEYHGWILFSCLITNGHNLRRYNRLWL